MSKILCGISGIEFNCEHLPLSIDSGKLHHPVFSPAVPFKKLIPLVERYLAGELNPTDSYLTFLAILHSTNLVEFRVPAAYTEHTSSIIAQNIDSLLAVTSRILSVRNPKVKFSHIAITAENRNLANVKYWILNWQSSYEDYQTGYKAQQARADLSELEERIDALRISPNRTDINFATKLAEWAAKAGEFPVFPVSVGGATMTCADYWKQIIRKCVNADSIFSINSSDLQELTDHCYTNIEVGSIYSHELFALLKEGAQRQSGFLGISNWQFSILPQNSAVEEANKEVIIQSAPTSAPRRIDYQSQFEYIKAKLAYGMAQTAAAQRELNELQHTGDNNSTEAV